MTYNRKSSKKISRVCLYIALIMIGYTVAIKMHQVKPELGVLNSLETVQTLQKSIKGLFVAKLD